jgi:hypothetical protein
VLPSLRPLIADGMVALAAVGYMEPGRYHWNSDREAILARGAATLRWCDENDPDVDPCGEEADRTYQLMQALDDVRAAVLAWDTSTDICSACRASR